MSDTKLAWKINQSIKAYVQVILACCEEQIYMNLNNTDYNFYFFPLFEKHECYKQIPSLSYKPLDISLYSVRAL